MGALTTVTIELKLYAAGSVQPDVAGSAHTLWGSFSRPIMPTRCFA